MESKERGISVIGHGGTTIIPKQVTVGEAIDKIDRSWFHVAVLFVTGWITAAVVVEISCPAHLIPSAAACELGMNSYGKGLLGSMAFAGMVTGAQFWGVTADLKGRRFVLQLIMLCNGCLGILTSLMPSLPFFLVGRYFAGFFIASGSACSATFLGEFHTEEHRGQAIVRLAFFPGSGAFLFSGVAYGIFLQQWEVPLPWITFTPWRFFVICSSLPCLIGGLALFWFPESPRFLASRGRHGEALEVLARMWSYSTKQSPSEYPVKALLIRTPEKLSTLKTLRNQTVPLFRPPHLKNTLLLCFSLFSVLTTINGLMVWYPEIFNRMAQYAALRPGEEVTACTAIDYVMKNVTHSSLGENGDDAPCITNLEPKVFLRTAIINFFEGFFPLLGILITKWVGNTRLLNTCMITGSILMAAGMNTVTGQTGVIVMATSMSSVIAICITLSLGVSVDIYPTQLRAFGASTAILCGRLGGLCGSLLVAVLIQLYCPAVFWSLSSLLFVAGCLSLLLPHKKKMQT